MEKDFSNTDFLSILPKKNQKSLLTIIVLTEEERSLIQNLFNSLQLTSPETMINIASRIMELERLAVSISRYPSIYEQSILAGETRSRETLVEGLCKIITGARILNVPTKVVLGKGYLVAKFNTFSAITKIAMTALLDEADIKALRNITLNIMFTLMVEDVYLTLLDKPDIRQEIRKTIALSLTDLWEHRLDKQIKSFAPVLTKVWMARDKIAPTFGTMLGSSELFLLSMELDQSWQKFMIEKMSDPDVGMALEEFLFGISYENIEFIRQELKTKGLSAIGREEVAELLGTETYLSEIDLRKFYGSFIERKANAEARTRLRVQGPKRTLEDCYIQFTFEQHTAKELMAKES